MLELRRIEAGIFDESTIVNLYGFEKAADKYKKEGNEELLRKIILPADEVIKLVYPEVQIKGDNLKQILTGKPIYKKELVKDEGWKVDLVVCVFCEGKFIGMYKIMRGKEIFAKPEFVFQNIEQNRKN